MQSLRVPRLSSRVLTCTASRSAHYSQKATNNTASNMSLRESRGRVVPSLWDRIFRSDFDAIERMLAPGFAYEVMPEIYRPIFSGLPGTGVLDPRETVEYFKQIREKMLAEPTVSTPSEQQEMNVTEQSMGENSLQTRFITKGRDARGEPYDIKHSLFLEFAEGDKIKRGVEYIESDSLNLHLKREQSNKDWQPFNPAKPVEDQPQQQQQAQVEGAQAKGESTIPAATSQENRGAQRQQEKEAVEDMAARLA
ncbi:hypothetical protein JCM10908_005874 [Rhodotorula pacifica]|uniref:uncharacterized protein n=1 Tax=Rhodotorula pacifica TaxID=1495444 RepID=UPI00317BC7BE